MAVKITISVPDELGKRLQAYRERLPELLERGLRDIVPRRAPIRGWDLILTLGLRRRGFASG